MSSKPASGYLSIAATPDKLSSPRDIIIICNIHAYFRQMDSWN